MITFISGHRGTGKTQLLERLQSYFEKDLCCIDLDHYISQSEDLSISEIFKNYGESHFRDLEKKYSQQLYEKYKDSNLNVFISLGAGIKGPLPNNAHCLWISRSSDPKGRVFLNRPRLNTDISPLQEYMEKVSERDSVYSQFATDELCLTEGFDFPNDAEKSYFQNSLKNLNASITILPKHFNSDTSFKAFIEKRKTWGIQFFEIRNDLLSWEQAHLALKSLPQNQVLISFRNNNYIDELSAYLKKSYTWDWAIELAENKKFFAEVGSPSIVSLHERLENESLTESLQRLEAFTTSAQLKWAPTISNFKELEEGYAWWQQDPTNRSFLPRSSNGQWSWYRLWLKDQQKLNFIRESQGSSPDQPTILDWLYRGDSSGCFAAILGDPVDHSRTCAEQFDFFNNKKIPVLRIKLSQQEWLNGAFYFLKSMGLKYAAVTSPLKLLAFENCDQTSSLAQDYKSVNTLYLQGKIIGHNTDLSGLKKLFNSLEDGKDVAVWGGGGTLPLIRALLPRASYYSARTGQLREGSTASSPPKSIIWAAGSGKELQSPPQSWTAEQIIDLNYTENSAGLEYALKIGAEYTSGITMFTEQAQKQREFWGQYER